MMYVSISLEGNLQEAKTLFNGAVAAQANGYVYEEHPFFDLQETCLGGIGLIFPM